MPLIVVLYLIAFMDRVNVALAVQAINKDVGLTPAVYGLGGGIFLMVPRCLVWVIAKLTHVWDIQIKLTGSMVGCGSEVDEVSKATSHSFC